MATLLAAPVPPAPRPAPGTAQQTPHLIYRCLTLESLAGYGEIYINVQLQSKVMSLCCGGAPHVLASHEAATRCCPRQPSLLAPGSLALALHGDEGVPAGWALGQASRLVMLRLLTSSCTLCTMKAPLHVS